MHKCLGASFGWRSKKKVYLIICWVYRVTESRPQYLLYILSCLRPLYHCLYFSVPHSFVLPSFLLEKECPFFNLKLFHWLCFGPHFFWHSQVLPLFISLSLHRQFSEKNYFYYFVIFSSLLLNSLWSSIYFIQSIEMAVVKIGIEILVAEVIRHLSVLI